MEIIQPVQSEIPGGPDSGARRVLRSGCWGDFAKGCRSASRNWYWPDGRFSIFCLRVARSAPLDE